MSRLALALVLTSVLTACLGPSIQGVPVTVTEEDFNEYWRQLVRRWPAYFRGQCVRAPELPDRDDIRSRVSFEEVPAAFLATCTFNTSTYRIRIGDDKWASGCVPHELGHAACQFLEDGMDDSLTRAQLLACAEFEHVRPREGCE